MMGPLPDFGPALKLMLVLAGLGVVALGVAGVVGVWWIVTHVSLVIS